MSTCVHLFREGDPDRMLEVVDRAGIQSVLRAVGVGYRYLPVPYGVGRLEPDVIRVRLAAEIDAVSAEFRYAAVDVVRMTPDHPDRAAERARFRVEHVHEDDEVRWFVDGGGVFWIRGGGLVIGVVCGPGDWLRVPALTRHWFDMGYRPSFCEVRWFSHLDGWRGRTTGDPIAALFPSAEALSR